jgi:hypothetical protein
MWTRRGLDVDFLKQQLENAQNDLRLERDRSVAERERHVAAERFLREKNGKQAARIVELETQVCDLQAAAARHDLVMDLAPAIPAKRATYILKKIR